MTARSHSRTGFEVILGANFARAVDPPGKSTHLRPPQRIEARWRSGDVEDCKSSHPGSIPGRASNLYIIGTTVERLRRAQAPETVHDRGALDGSKTGNGSLEKRE